MQSESRLVRLLDGQRLSRWHVGVVFCGFLSLFLDGMDISAPSVTTSAILKGWGSSTGALAQHFTDWGWPMNPMGLAFSAGNVGTLLGLLIFSTVGDRVGRKRGLISSVILYSVPCCLVLWPVFREPDLFIALRLVCGLGLGGVMPNAIALVAEMVPARLRAGLMLVTLTGYAVGAILSGLLAAWFTAAFGWSLLFVVPGAAGLLVAMLFAAKLPESLKFLAVNAPESAQFARLSERLLPGENANELARDARATQPPARAHRFGELFEGRLRVLTPTLWLGYFAICIAFLSLLSWQTFLLEQLGVPTRLASLSFSLASIAAVLLQLSMAPLVDRFGPMPAAAVATVAMAGLLSLAALREADSALKVAAIVIAVGCGSVTLQMYGMTSGLFYPTPIRGRGVGWAGGVGRIGSVTGPAVAGHVFASHIPAYQVLYLMALPYLIVVPVCTVLGVLYLKGQLPAVTAPGGNLREGESGTAGIRPRNPARISHDRRPE